MNQKNSFRSMQPRRRLVSEKLKFSGIQILELAAFLQAAVSRAAQET